MIKKIRASKSEKFIYVFLILLGITTFCTLSYIVLKINVYLSKIMIQRIFILKNQIILQFLNAPCGNVIIELYPNISPNAVQRFITLIRSNAYENIAFHQSN